MIWQDIVISLVQWGSAIALLPTIINVAGKPPLLTSMTTGVLLLILSATFSTLQLWSSTISMILT